MRHWGHITDNAHIKSIRLQSPDSRFPPWSRPVDPNLYLAHAMFLGFFCSGIDRILRSKWGAFP